MRLLKRGLLKVPKTGNSLRVLVIDNDEESSIHLKLFRVVVMEAGSECAYSMNLIDYNDVTILRSLFNNTTKTIIPTLKFEQAWHNKSAIHKLI